MIFNQGVNMTKTNKSLLLSALITGAVAGSAALTSQPVFADDKVDCYGANSCSGKSECKTMSHDCKGQNSCKGQAKMKMTKKDCMSKGGSLTDKTKKS
jgi:hypothetical protein